MVVTAIAVIAAALAIWAIVDVSRNSDAENKAFWFAIVILLPIAGPLSYSYYFANKRRKIKKLNHE